MDFFGIGPWEILLILIVALIVMGPGKLPEFARTVGKTMRAIRKASAELTTAVTKELEATQKEPTPSQPKEVIIEQAVSKISTPPEQKNQPTEPGGDQQQK